MEPGGKAANSAPVLACSMLDTAWDLGKESSVQAEGVGETKERVAARLLPAYLALIAGIACIAWSAIFVRWTDIPGPASAFYRMLIPAVVLLPTVLFDRDGTRLSRHMLWICELGGLCFSLALVLY